MPKAIRVHAHGGPEVLTYEDFDPGQPGAGEVRVRRMRGWVPQRAVFGAQTHTLCNPDRPAGTGRNGN